MVLIRRQNSIASTGSFEKGTVPRSPFKNLSYQSISDLDDLEVGRSSSKYPFVSRFLFLNMSTIIQILIIGCLCTFYVQSYINLTIVTDELTKVQSDFKYTEEAYQGAALELRKLHIEWQGVRLKTVGKYKRDAAEHIEKDVTTTADAIVEHHVEQVKRINSLQEKVQSYYRIELEKRFGPGPYFVEFKLRIDGRSKYFTAKMAGDIMPHSVFVFMDMVERQVWNDTVFIHKWGHIVQAAPISTEGTSREISNGELIYPEYSEQFTHQEYTLGFSGRPAGPEFYINTADNVKSHGPGAQGHSAVLNDADPCFARIIVGTETVDLLKQKSLGVIENAHNGEGIAFSSIESVERIFPDENSNLHNY